MYYYSFKVNNNNDNNNNDDTRPISTVSTYEFYLTVILKLNYL